MKIETGKSGEREKEGLSKKWRDGMGNKGLGESVNKMEYTLYNFLRTCSLAIQPKIYSKKKQLNKGDRREQKEKNRS